MEHINSGEELSQNKKPKENGILLYLHDLVHALAWIMVIFLLLFRMVIVSGSSMYSTLWDGDCLLLLSNTVYHNPEQGDIIVASKDSFRNGEAIIKRVIATEGQTVDIDFEAGIVYVDNVALDEPYTYTPTNHREGMEFPLVVEDGCLFVMGDNRNGSLDSRSHEIGMVDKREILGKALFLVIPGADERTHQRDFDRIGALK